MRTPWIYQCRAAGAALLVFGLVFYSSGLAQEAGLSLEKAVEIALAGHPDILLAQQGFRSAAGRKLRAGAIADPDVIFRDEGLSFRKASSTSSESELSLGVEQSFEFPGKRALRREIGALGEEQAGLELARVRRLVAAAVKKAYYKAVLVRRTVEALRASDETLDQLIANLEIQYRAGTASTADILRARVEKARLRNQIIEEEKNEAAAKTDLNLAMGRAGDEPATLTTDLAFLPFPKSLDEAKNQARNSSALLKILSSREKQAESSLRLSRMNILPDFSLGLYYPSLHGSAWGFSFGLSVPLWRSKRQGEIMEAEAARETAVLSSAQEERRLAARVDTAYAGVKAAERQVRVFEQELLRDMQDELSASLSRFEYGKMDFFNLLDLFRTFAAAKLEYVKSIYLYLVSVADLEVAGEGPLD